MDLMRKVLSEAYVEAVVIRCRCGDPQSHDGAVCPVGQNENLGIISYWHRSFWKRLAWRLSQWLHWRRPGGIAFKE